MDNTNKKIGCYLGSGQNSRTKIIDPNAFYGETDSSRNIPVKNEDLTISVKLTTRKRGRTTIIQDSVENQVILKEQGNATINFTEGSDINGKKVLTTKFTELTTVFETDTLNPETFGITNIDIDFNTSYVPSVKIDFVDVRGSSIFQNEELLLQNNAENKYATFFEFPYPLFELEIKGYYGQPVTYCLHMLKFNSKFNSQTGNFEISCEFIGYTYAMLSDMLIGILKAIPFTKIGEEKFKNYNDSRLVKTLDLVELNGKIANINNAIQKAAESSDDSKLINSFKEANEILGNLEAAINDFSQFSLAFDNTTTTTTVYNFVVMANFDFSTQQNTKFNSINDTIKSLVKSYNELNIDGLNINETNMVSPRIINNLTKKSLNSDDLTINEVPSLKDKAALDSFKKELLSYLDNNLPTTVTEDYIFRVMDLRNRFAIITAQKELVEKSLEDTNKSLANQIKDTVTATLGFKPTVRAMVETFTALIEVFIETVFEVSSKAETNEVRKELFKKIFDGKNGDYNTIEPNTIDSNYYPWPAYSEQENQKTGFVDKYLGSNSELKNKISDVPELQFIDDLLQAFLKAKRREEELKLLNAGNETIFFPVNPLDTKLFQPTTGNPYARKELIDKEQVKRLMLIRGMTYLGYTNDEKYLTTGETGEIQKMAKIEANTLLSALINPVLKVSLKNLKFDDLLETYGKINSSDVNLISYDSSQKKYYYTYYYDIEPKTGLKVLPINSDLNGVEITTISNGGNIEVNALSDLSDKGIIFLTNYGSGINLSKSVNTLTKPIDYGIYVKMFTPQEYTNSLTLVDTSIDTNSVIDLKQLKDNNIANAGFNSFGGSYGIQDFSKMNFGDEAPADTPLMYVFYQNNSENRNGLAYSRSKSNSIQTNKNGKSNTSIYDFDKTKTSIPLLWNRGGYLLNNPLTQKDLTKIHEGIGSSRFLANKINTSLSEISYPYIEQLKDDGDFSLFGSKWYYLQKDAKCTYSTGTQISAEKYVKALLFLNTLPFNIDLDTYDPLGRPEIKHLFDVKGGFVHAPRLWVAYVGGILWWLSKEDPFMINGSNQITAGGRGIKDPVIWKITCGSNAALFDAPTDGQYFPKIIGDNKTVENSSVIRALPEQVADEFKKVFFDFVNGTSSYTSFDSLASKLEITNKTPTQFCGFLDRMRYKTNETTPSGQPGLLTFNNSNRMSYVDPEEITANLINYDNYNIITTIPEYVGKEYNDTDRHTFRLELNGASEVGNNLITAAFTDEIIIANTGYGVWQSFTQGGNINSGNDVKDLRRPIGVSEANFKEYFETFISVISDAVSGSTLTNEQEKEVNEIFGTTNKNDIKLMLYGHCKNIYDKWLGGVTDANNVIFQCGDNSRVDSNRKTIDANMAKKYGSDKPRLIDSFRFVTRSFKDIGDELYVNPLPIQDQISDYPNTSAYSVISGLLNDNKFEFISLPTYINYYDDDMLKSVFEPFDYNNSITSCGPTFVSVYTGQKSKRLDIKSSKYPNDGFDMRCVDGTPDVSIPKDYSEPLNNLDINGNPIDNGPYEDVVPVFVVNYSQQNQNIFKDITLDQSEFTETEESLKIIQDISMKGSENSPSIAGQNMYNIYAVRSYSAEVEMLGNAMIQPMMYFQLNNVPMFHGAYMIIRTRHNIKPNHMTTWFTGSRIRAVETPIIDVADAYMNLIETLDLTSAGKAKSGNAFTGLVLVVQEVLKNLLRVILLREIN